MTETPDDSKPKALMPAWLGLVVAAALVAIVAGIGFGAWHDRIRGPEYSSVADIQNRGKIDDACFAANPNSVAAVTQCENDNGIGAPSYPWPTTHVWLSAGIVFLAVLVLGRGYVFMRRLETRDK